MPKFKSQLITGEARLAEVARREAQAITPQFSDALHERVMRAVRAAPSPRQRAAITLQKSRPVLLRHRWLVPAALAALLVVVLSPMAVRRDGNRPPEVVVVRPVETPAVPSPHVETTALGFDQTADQLNASMQTMVQTTMAHEKWAGLDVDVRRATQFLVDQVPLRAALQDGAADETGKPQ